MSLIRKIFGQNRNPFKLTALVHGKIHRNLVPVYLCNDRKNDGSNRANSWKFLAAFASGYVALKLFTEHFPNVEAAIPLVASNSRRKQFNFVADVVELAAPAVVYIEIKDTRRTEFFTGKAVTISNGSGFIIEQDGLILTNAHVVANKPYSRVEVKLLNGQVYQGVVESLDMKSDLATVRIQARNLPTIKLGNSSEVRPGEFVVAIGSPLTLSNTVTSGVISSTHRASDELGLRDKDMVYLQTDAPITFGNSGGPLVNLDGEAIGISSMKVTAGISFAIPSDYVKKFLGDTKNKPLKAALRKRYMGITMLTLTPQILHQMQQRHQPVPADIRGGVLVWKVIIGSPAHNAGLQPGDIVTHIDGNLITNSDDIYAVLNSSSNNIKSLRMTVRRGEAYNQETVLFVTPEMIE